MSDRHFWLVVIALLFLASGVRCTCNDHVIFDTMGDRP